MSICKIVDKKTFEKFDEKVKKMQEINKNIDFLEFQQMKINKVKNRIFEVKEYKRAKSYYNSLLLQYDSIVKASEHFEKIQSVDYQKINNLGFKTRKKLQSMQKGEKLQIVRLEYRGVLSRQIVIARDEMEEKRKKMEDNEFYKKLVKDYNSIQLEKRILRKEVNNLKKSLKSVKIAPRAVLFGMQEDNGKYIYSGISWIPKTRMMKKIKTY